MTPKKLRVKRKRMTLIAAFKCSDGILLCADSQETIGDHRVARLKIRPFNLGDRFEVAMGGSGDGDTLDAFVQSIKDEWQESDANDIESFGVFLRKRLQGFLDTEMPLIPEDRRDIKFLIGARCAAPVGIAAWETKATRLLPVSTDAVLIGCDYTVYERPAQRHHKPTSSISRTIPLAMYIFALAEDTSNYVRFPVTIVALTEDHPIYVEYEWAVEHFREKTEVFTAALESMLLVCADATVRSDDFDKKFKEFADTILQLRKDYFQDAANLEMQGFFEGKWPNFPFRRLPFGTTLSWGTHGATAKENDEEARQLMAKVIKEHDELIERMRSSLKQSAFEKSELGHNQFWKDKEQ
jgi:hypothetical protein